MNAGTDHPPLDDPKDNELGGLSEPVCPVCGACMDDEEARCYGGHVPDCAVLQEIPR